MPGRRRQARILAMQALCQWDTQKDESPESLDAFLTASELVDPDTDLARELVQAFWQDRQRVDDRIAAAATNWDLSRISSVERNVMRVAVVEMLRDMVPQKVAIDEAIEIGREYGGKESPRFINGVLDVIMKRLQGKRRDGG